MFMDNDIYLMAKETILTQAIWAFTGPLTEKDKNPDPVPVHERGDISFVTGYNEDGSYILSNTQQEYLTFTGASYEEVAWKFNEAAAYLKFSDGIPLIPPTRELVDAMLAGTTRKPGDIIGQMDMRGGILSVEKIATIAVMAGCKPEQFPVIVAAAEGLGNAWEEDASWWHPMTSGSSNIVMSMIVSGPIAKEIGMSFDVGQIGSGNEVSNSIGRTLRMFFLIVSHNMPGHIDTSGYKPRLNDITLTVMAENMDVLEEIGWNSHSVEMGFGEESSCVVLLGATTGNWPFAPSSAFNANWSPSTLLGYLNMSTLYTGLSGANLSIALYSPAVARLMAETYGNKQDLRDLRQPIMEKAEYAGKGITTNFAWPVVVGGDPGGAFNAGATYYLTNTYHAQKITGATLTNSSRDDDTAPSAPQNFEVEIRDGIAYLSWDAPATDGGSPIIGYQVYYLDGANDLAHRWVDVPGGAAARECYFTNLQPGVQYFFKVRARNEVDNARFYVNTGGDLNLSNVPDSMKVWGLRTPLERTAGKGGMAYFAPITMAGKLSTLNSNNYPQINGKPIKLWYAAPMLTPDYNYTTGTGGELYWPTEMLYGPGTVIDPTLPVFYTVTFAADNGTVDVEVSVEEGELVAQPADPAKGGFRFLGWFVGSDEFDFDTPIIDDITITAMWEPLSDVPITSIVINSTSAMTTVSRNSTITFSVTLNSGASDEGIEWSVSNPALASVDEHGTVKIKNTAGMVFLTAKDPVSGLLHMITLRIV
jgi:hypothetical protein